MFLRVLDDGLLLDLYALAAGRILGFCLGWGLDMAGAEVSLLFTVIYLVCGGVFQIGRVLRKTSKI